MLWYARFGRDQSHASLRIRDYSNHIFSKKDLPTSVAGCRLDEVSLNSLLALGYTNFRGASFYQTDFSKIDPEKLKLLDLSYAIFFESNLATTFTKCNLTGAVFTSNCQKLALIDCTLYKTNFTGAPYLQARQVLNNQRWQEARYFDHEQIMRQARKILTEEQAQANNTRVKNILLRMSGDAPHQQPKPAPSFVQREEERRALSPLQPTRQHIQDTVHYAQKDIERRGAYNLRQKMSQRYISPPNRDGQSR